MAATSQQSEFVHVSGSVGSMGYLGNNRRRECNIDVVSDVHVVN